MKRWVVAVVFLFSFLSSLLLFSPWEVLVDYFLGKVSQNFGVGISYEDRNAGLGTLRLSSLRLCLLGRALGFDNVDLRFFPTKLKVKEGDATGDISLRWGWRRVKVVGAIDVKLVNFLLKQLGYAPFHLEGRKLTLTIDGTFRRGVCLIKQLLVKGKNLRVEAKGYLTKKRLSLEGVWEFSGVKRRFRL